MEKFRHYDGELQVYLVGLKIKDKHDVTAVVTGIWSTVTGCGEEVSGLSFTSQPSGSGPVGCSLLLLRRGCFLLGGCLDFKV